MTTKRIFFALAATALAALGLSASSPVAPAPLARVTQDQQPVIELKISGNTGTKPVIAIPEFSTTGATPEMQQAAKAISDVLWNDVDYEHEFTVVSRDAAA